MDPARPDRIGPDIARPPRALCDRLALIGTATASSELSRVFGELEVHADGPELASGVRRPGPPDVGDAIDHCCSVRRAPGTVGALPASTPLVARRR